MFVVGRVVVAALFLTALIFMLVRRSWIGATIVLPFAAAQTYFAVAAARGGNLGYRP